MGGAFDWLSALIETISKVFPRLVHVTYTHRGVCFKRSKYKTLEPGLHWYWPVVSKVVLHPVKRQTVNLWPQSLTTRDKKEVIAAATIVYEICDISKAVVETTDFVDTIDDLGQLGVKEVIQASTLDEILADSEDADKKITRAIRSELHSFGVRVIRCFLYDFSKAIVVRNIQNSRGGD